MRIVRFLPIAAISLAAAIWFGGTALAGGAYGSTTPIVDSNASLVVSVKGSRHYRHGSRGSRHNRHSLEGRATTGIILAGITVHTGGMEITSATASGTRLIIPTGDPITAMIITSHMATTGTIDDRPGQAKGGDIAARGISVLRSSRRITVGEAGESKWENTEDVDLPCESGGDLPPTLKTPCI